MPAEPFDLHACEGDELQKLVDKAGGQRAFSRKHAIARSTLQLALARGRKEVYTHRPAPGARVEVVDTGLRRFILSAAQDGTRVHEEFLSNLEAYRDHLLQDGPCELLIAGFTYNKSHVGSHKVTKGSKPLYHERVRPYLVDERIRLGDRIDYCGEMNTLPTAETPLMGFETYTRERCGIIPHAKVQLRSIPTMKNSPAKIIMTTGAVTKPNYIPKRAGIKASFNHAIGAVLVEIASDGVFFARHLLAEDDGTFIDLDREVRAGVVTEGHRTAAINWGDLHTAQIDAEVARTCFGYAPTDLKTDEGRVWAHYEGQTMLDALRPNYQFFHDVADFQSRNHHNLHDPHLMFSLHCKGRDSVESELKEVATFIEKTKRPWSTTVIVESNHDLALKKWLKHADYREDPLNAEFFLDCQRQTYKAIRRKDEVFSVFQYVMTDHFEDLTCKDVIFLREDESMEVLGIEKGMHGHLGANGARGSPQAFTKMGPKASTGHTHSCEIRDGIYTAGTSSNLDMGYNKGLSSWSHSHIVTLLNGKRQIVTMQGGRWRL